MLLSFVSACSWELVKRIRMKYNDKSVAQYCFCRWLGVGKKVDKYSHCHQLSAKCNRQDKQRREKILIEEKYTFKNTVRKNTVSKILF